MDGKWQDIDSWTVIEGTTSAKWPGPGDKAVFAASDTRNCTEVDATQVADIDIQAGYTGVISLQEYNSSTGGGALEVTNSFRMADGFLNNVSNPLGIGDPGLLKLTGSSVFIWSGGQISRDEVMLGSGVTGSITSSVSLQRSTLDNSGTLTWSDGDIRVPQGQSTIANHGTFNVQSRGSLFDPAAGRNVGWLTNDGTLKFIANGTGIQADFTNQGTVQVYGWVGLYYKAEQLSGTFELRNGTVARVGTDVPLQIRDGSIQGSGTVDGNLTLGYETEYGGEPTTTARIAPGTARDPGSGIGVITIAHEFRMFGPADSMSIDVDTSGNSDQVVVNGVYAAPYGILYVTVAQSQTFKPVAGTKLPFLTSNSLLDSFTSINLYAPFYWSASDAPTKPHYWVVDSDSKQYYLLTKLQQMSGGAFFAAPDFGDDDKPDAVVTTV